MNYPWVDEYLLKKPAAHKDFKEEWGWYRYQIGDKMFAAVCLDEAYDLVLHSFSKKKQAELLSGEGERHD